MKWVLYSLAGVGGLLVLAVVVLLIMGGGRGESTLQTAVEIARPPQAVFAFLTEPQKIKSWVSWLVEIRDLTPGQSGVGSRTVWVMEDRNNNNQLMDIESTVVRYQQDALLEAQLSATMGFTGVVTYEVQPIDGNRSRLVYKASYKFDHWLAKLLEPVISRSAQQKLEEDLARLKQHAESAQPAARQVPTEGLLSGDLSAVAQSAKAEAARPTQGPPSGRAARPTEQSEAHQRPTERSEASVATRGL